MCGECLGLKNEKQTQEAIVEQKTPCNEHIQEVAFRDTVYQNLPLFNEYLQRAIEDVRMRAERGEFRPHDPAELQA